MNHTTIRVATPNDATAIRDIYAHYVENSAITFDYDVPSVAYFQSHIKETLAHYPYLVCVINHKVVGYAYAGPHMQQSAYQWNAVLSIYLDEKYTGYKIGQGLYQALLEILAFQHFKKLYACVTYPNERSQKLHESFGFKSIGIFPQTGFKNGCWYDDIWLEKRLGSANEAPNSIIPFSSLNDEKVIKILEKSCQRIPQDKGLNTKFNPVSKKVI